MTMTTKLETLFPLGTLTPDTTVEEWEEHCLALAVIVKATPWAVADWLAFGERNFPDWLERAERLLPTLSRDRLANLQVLGERFPPENRIYADHISASMHEEVMRFDFDDALDILDQAAAEGWNREEIRTAARDKKRELNGQPIPFPAKPPTAEQLARLEHFDNFVRRFNQLQPGESMIVTYAEAEALAGLAAAEADRLDKLSQKAA